MVIEFDSFREDMRDEAGNVLHENVLFWRATGTTKSGQIVAFHAPVWVEEDEVISAAREILAAKVAAFIGTIDG